MSYRLLSSVFNLIEREQLLSGTFPQCRKMIDFQSPSELEAKLPLAIGKEKLPEDALERILSEVAKYSLKTTHPGYYNQQFGGVDPYGVCAAMLAEALNTNGHTFEVAPVFMVIEKNFMEYVSKLFGWETGEGLFCGGGSMSNMYGMVLARHSTCPDLKKTGFFGSKPLAAFASEDTHYWIKKAGTWLGYGSDNIYLIPTDDYGRMNISKFEDAVKRSIQAGKKPSFVGATAGSTVLGAFDDFRSISKVCKKNDMWMHIDACWGGSAVLSEKWKHVMDGAELADSISWNVHKMMCAPIQSSIFVTRHVGKLKETLAVDAGYIFQPEKMYDKAYDLGEKSVQCGRKVDAFKVWFSFKAHGTQAMSDMVANAFDLSRQFADMVRSTEGFEMVVDTVQCTNVCFWYVPRSLRGQERTKEWWSKLDNVAPILKRKMVEAGSLMIGYQSIPSKGLCNFLRLVVTTGPPRTTADMQYVIDEIDRLGKTLIID